MLFADTGQCCLEGRGKVVCSGKYLVCLMMSFRRAESTLFALRKWMVCLIMSFRSVGATLFTVEKD